VVLVDSVTPSCPELLWPHVPFSLLYLLMAFMPHASPPPLLLSSSTASKNNLELRSNSPQWVYSTAPLVKPDGTPVDHPQAGAAGYAMQLNDKQVGGRVGGLMFKCVDASLYVVAERNAETSCACSVPGASSPIPCVLMSLCSCLCSCSVVVVPVVCVPLRC